MTLTDKNGKPLNGAERKPPKNGQSGDSVVDVRTVPTGTLIYNLVLTGSKELGARAMIQQLEMMKVQQKMVAEPPELAAMRAEHANLENARYVMAAELNARFKDFDAAFAARRGIEMHEPGELASEPPKENSGGEG